MTIEDPAASRPAATARDGSAPLLVPDLRALIARWRVLGEFFATHTDPHQRDGAKLLNQCADDLDALLRSAPPT